MVCKRCNTEFDGNYCPNCGAKKDFASNVDFPKQEDGTIVKKFLPLGVGVIVLLVAVIVLSILSSMMNGYKTVGKQLQIGMTQDAVIAKLGEPVSKEDGYIEYYNYGGARKKTGKANEGLGRANEGPGRANGQAGPI